MILYLSIFFVSMDAIFFKNKLYFPKPSYKRENSNIEDHFWEISYPMTLPLILALSN